MLRDANADGGDWLQVDMLDEVCRRLWQAWPDHHGATIMAGPSWPNPTIMA
jgi:hypothetical protein